MKNYYMLYGINFNNVEISYRLINCFLSDKQKILFESCNFIYENLTYKQKNKLAEEDFGYYLEGVAYFNSINTEDKIMNFIKNKLIDLNITNNYDKDENEYVKEVLKNNQILPTNILKEIKEYISYCIQTEIRPREIYIKQNTIFQDTPDISYSRKIYEKIEGNKIKEENTAYRRIWYLTYDEYKIKEAIRYNFSAIITDDLDHFDNYSYFIEGMDTMENFMVIKDAKNNFTRNIVPKIVKEFGNKCKIYTSSEWDEIRKTYWEDEDL